MDDVKKIEAFLDPGYGFGSGHGSGDGFGFGHGSGDGSGDGFGFGHGFGSGKGSGFGHGFGFGHGSGDGSGSGVGDGSGDGEGGIKAINGQLVHLIDGVQTIIDRVCGDVAKGRILMGDLTTKPCYVVKQNGMFAHGETLREARQAITEKLFDGMDEDERIEAFMSEHKLGVPYPNQSLYEWHHRLTGSCDIGRKAFVADHGISLEDKSTVEEFVGLTKGAYGGSTIRRMWDRYQQLR